MTSVGPRHNVVFVRVIPTLKEIEENVLSFNVKVSHVSALKIYYCKVGVALSMQN